MARSYTRKKQLLQKAQHGLHRVPNFLFSKRRAPSPRKLEPHEVIERLKARVSVHG